MKRQVNVRYDNTGAASFVVCPRCANERIGLEHNFCAVCGCQIREVVPESKSALLQLKKQMPGN